MVYIYKKPVGENVYYYLRASERKNGKIITKDIAYLGSSLDEVKNKLEKLPKYSGEIRRAYKTIHNFLESNRYLEKARALKLKKDSFLQAKTADVEACRIHYLSDFKKNEELTKKEIIKNFVIEFAFNTTSIEGNTIKLEEAKKLLEEGLTPKDKSLREIYDVKNTEKVFLSLLKSKEEINHNLIIRIHKELMDNIDVRVGYRRTDIRVIKANFKATPAPYVKTDMDLLLRWHKENKNKIHPLALASVFHHKFEKIHPFMDGNGRTGRMLLDYILMINNYPPLIIHKKNRLEYLNALRLADKSDLTKSNKEDYQKLVDFIAEEMLNSYWNLFL
ncbi:MAG: Fic family protein [Nanoarchaeota archaeon]